MSYEIKPVEHYEVIWKGVAIAEFKVRAKAEEFISLLESQDKLYTGTCCQGTNVLADFLQLRADEHFRK